MVFFRSGACDLDSAARSLSGYGLTVTRQGDQLTASRPGRPKFRVRLAAGDWVGAEANEVGEGTEHADAMRGRDARFEISIESTDNHPPTR
jgi:hypothetical protein